MMQTLKRIYIVISVAFSPLLVLLRSSLRISGVTCAYRQQQSIFQFNGHRFEVHADITCYGEMRGSYQIMFLVIQQACKFLLIFLLQLILVSVIKYLARMNEIVKTLQGQLYVNT